MKKLDNIIFAICRSGKILLWLLILMAAILLPRCREDISPQQRLNRDYSKEIEKLQGRYSNWQSYQHQWITVYYQTGLERFAEELAHITDEMVLHVEQRTNLLFDSEELTILLFNTAHEYPTSQERDTYWGQGNHFKCCRDIKHVISLYVPARADLEAVLVRNRLYPWPLVHEMVEGILSTSAASRGIEGQTDVILTRWFREGIADYAGFAAFEFLISKIDLAEPMNTTFIRNSRPNPFPNLDKIGTDIFYWPQGAFPDDPRKFVDHYAASFGLFMLIEHRYGKEAIGQIGKRANDMYLADGSEVAAICSETIGTDIIELVENFRFPDFGMETERLCSFFDPHDLQMPGLYVKEVQPGGLAEKSGLREGDVILRANNHDVSVSFDLEYSVLRSLGNNEITLEVWRQDKGIFQVSFFW